MINTGETCICGDEKKIMRQWCDVCWEGIGMFRREDYIRSLNGLHAAIVAGDRILEISRKNGEQPDLSVNEMIKPGAIYTRKIYVKEGL